MPGPGDGRSRPDVGGHCDFFFFVSNANLRGAATHPDPDCRRPAGGFCPGRSGTGSLGWFG